MDIDQMLESLGGAALVSAKLKPQTREQHNAVSDVFDRIVNEELAPRLTVNHVREGDRSAVRILGTRIGSVSLKAFAALADEYGLEFGIYAETEVAPSPMGGDRTIGRLHVLIAPSAEYEDGTAEKLVDAVDTVLH